MLIDCIVQQDGAPPHFHREIREVMNRVLLQRWTGPMGSMTIRCSGDHPGLDSLHLFLWDCVKDTVHVPPLSRNLQELQNRVVAALRGVTTDMLQRVWEEIDSRLDVCRVTRGAHTEGL
jgi:hypothetical protein